METNRQGYDLEELGLRNPVDILKNPGVARNNLTKKVMGLIVDALEDEFYDGSVDVYIETPYPNRVRAIKGVLQTLLLSKGWEIKSVSETPDAGEDQYVIRVGVARND
jgi:hypothetical protein